MRSAFATRRPKARKIGPDNDLSDEEKGTKRESATIKSAPSTLQSNDNSSPVVRPRPKKRSSKLRLSFGPDEQAEAESEPVFTPKKSTLSQKAIERNAARRIGLPVGQSKMGNLSLSSGQETVKYSKEYLDELKNAQVSASREAAKLEEQGDDAMSLDEDDTSSMGTVGSGREASIALTGLKTEIPDEGLIRVMKERRKQRAEASKAGAEDFISLETSASDNRLTARTTKKESRLVTDEYGDDEDMQAYIESDEKLLLGNDKASRREQERKRRQNIRDTIAEAEGGTDVDSDDSGQSVAEDWERDQIRKGAFSSADGPHGFEAEMEIMGRNPPVVMALPDLGDVLARLTETLHFIESRKLETERHSEALAHEKRQIHERERMVQEGLTKVGAEYESRNKDTGLAGGGPDGVVSRGLESFGNTPIRVEEN